MKRGAVERKPWAGWKWFGVRDKDGQKKCLCRVGDGLCGAVLTYSNTTHNFKKHLAHQHPEIYQSVKEEGEADAASPAPAPALAPPGQATLNDFYDPSKLKEYQEASTHLIQRIERELVRFIAGDLRPFSAVEGLSSSTMLVFLNFLQEKDSRASCRLAEAVFLPVSSTASLQNS
jgi:hypothetical protein